MSATEQESKPETEKPEETNQPSENNEASPKELNDTVASPGPASEEAPAEDEEAKKKREEEAAQQKAKDDEEARKKAEEDAAQKEADLEAAIASLEKENADLEKALDEKVKEAEEATADQETARSQLKEAQERHSEAVKIFNTAEQQKFELQPAYEQCLASQEQKERAEQYKKSIEELEVVVSANESEISRLDGEMEKASSDYANEKEKLETLTKELNTQLEDLDNSVTSKIEATIDGPPVSDDEPESAKEKRAIINLKPLFLLDGLEAIARQREREASHAARQLRELRAICEMKAEEEEKLQSETGDQLAIKQKENDEHLKQLIYGFQDLRSNLQADIEEIRRVNKEQAYNLSRGHVEKSGGRGAFGSPTSAGSTTPRSGAPRQSSFRKEAESSKEVTALKQLNEEMQTQLNTLKKKLTAATVDRTDSLKTHKQLQNQLSRDQIRFREDLRKVEADVAAKYLEVDRAERENKRLAEAVEHLTTIVDTTRKQVQHIRSHHDPLPIEETEN